MCVQNFISYRRNLSPNPLDSLFFVVYIKTETVIDHHTWIENTYFIHVTWFDYLTK